ncbi:MAG: hypothetical protein K9N21_19625 [Deltaproteobacteria bacterium]|nr:hypothetical protein [Deltaproteobacteria bacterium]
MTTHDIVMGIITSRNCPTCGHHEVGYETVDGTFVPLRPGDRIALLPKSPAAGPEDAIEPPPMPVHAEEKDPAHWAVWVPEPLRSDRGLCRKYGVPVDKALVRGDMSPGLYEMAYRQKLQWLIEKEAYTPVSVILDRFFVAPHLASGNAKQAADALWAELDEIKGPVTRVAAWLRDKSEPSLVKMIHPKTSDDLTGDMLGDDQLKEELDRMSLEEFLEAL